MKFHQGLHLSRQLVCRRCSVTGKWNTTECQDYFRKDWLIDRETRNGECSPVRWMRMTDSLHVRTFAINQKVHGKLAGSFALVERFAFKIRDGDQILRHASLAGHRRRSKDAAIVEAYAHVAVRRNDVTPFVHQVANSNQ